jgi:hypothetical protein
MTRHAVAAGCALALTFASTAVGAGHQPRTIVLRIVSTPTTVGPSTDCPGGEVHSRLVSRAGRPAGTSIVCVLSSSITHPPGAVVGKLTEQVVETDSIEGGQIVSRQRQVFRFNRDGTRAQASFRGKVIRGTGRYEAARGTISGGGPMGVADVTRPRFVLTIKLR